MATINAISVALFNAAAGGYAAEMEKNGAAFANAVGPVLEKDISTDALFVEHLLGNLGVLSTNAVYSQAKAAVAGLVAAKGRLGATVDAIDFLKAQEGSTSAYATIAATFAAKVNQAATFTAANSTERDITKLISGVTGVDTDAAAIAAATAAVEAAAATAAAAAATKAAADLAAANAAAEAAATKAAADLAAANAAAEAAATKAAADLAAANAAATAAAEAAATAAAAALAAAEAEAAADLAAANAAAEAAAAAATAAAEAAATKAAADLAAANATITALQTPVPVTAALSTETDDLLVGVSGANDTFTGTTTTDDSTDIIVDRSATDNDTLTLTLTAAPAAMRVEGIENIVLNESSTSAITNAVGSFKGVSNLTITKGNVTVGGSTIVGNKVVTVTGLDASEIAKVTVGAGTTDVAVTQATATGVTVDATTATGNITVTGAATVIASAQSTGDTVTVTAVADDADDLNSTNVSITTTAAGAISVADGTDGDADTTNDSFTGSISVTANNSSSVTIANATGGATVSATKAGATITVSNIDSTGATLTAGVGTSTSDVDFVLDGTAATTDKVTVYASGEVGLVVNNAQQIDAVTLGSNGAAVTYDLTAAAGASTTSYTLVGDKDVTLIASTAALTLTTVTDSTTAGTTTVELDSVATATLTKVAADNFVIAAEAADAQTLTFASGATFNIGNDQSNGLAFAASAAKGTLNLAVADDTDADGTPINIDFDDLTASTNVTTVNLTATVGTFSANSTTLASTGVLNVYGDQAVDLGVVIAKTISAGSFTGDLTAVASAATSPTTITTGSGADDLTVDEAVKFTVDAGSGDNTLTITVAADESVFTTGGGDDTVALNDDESYSIALGAGDDTLTLGADLTSDAVLAGGEGADTLVFADVNGQNLSSATNFSFTGFETVNISTLDGTAALTISSTQFANQTFALKGGSAATDVLSIVGSSSADTISAAGVTVTTATVKINGGVGNDTITGTKSADILIGGAGSDILNGGTGSDTASYTGAADDGDETGTQTGVVVNLSASSIAATTILGRMTTSYGYTAGSITEVESNTAAYLYGNTTSTNSASIDTLTSIENVVGTDGNDYIVGSVGANTITGGDGDDYLVGGLGADTYVFAATAADNGADVISGFVSGTDILDLDAFMDGITKVFEAEDDDSVATSITTNANVIAVGGATSIADAATFIAGDATVTGTTGIIIVDDGTDSFVYYTDNLAGNGTEVLVATLLGVTAAEALGAADFLFA